MVAAAIVGSAAIGAVGSSVAASKAGHATDKGSELAAAETRAAREQSERLSAPYRALGEKAIGTYEDLLGIGGKGSAGIQETLAALPGYQFAKSQGTESALRAAGASGMNLSGNQLAGVEQFGTNLADQTYGEQLQRLLQPISIGQGAAAGQAANAMNAGANLGNIYQNQGNTQAGIAANQIAGITGSIGQGANNLLTYRAIQGLNTPGQVSTPTPPPVATYGADPGMGMPGLVV